MMSYRIKERGKVVKECVSDRKGGDGGEARTNDDKRRVVTRMLEDAEWGGWSDREIARHCGVDHKFVAKHRKQLTGDIPSDQKQDRTYEDRWGNTHDMDTSAIGRQETQLPLVAVPVGVDPISAFYVNFRKGNAWSARVVVTKRRYGSSGQTL